jgi:hypothetical protein
MTCKKGGWLSQPLRPDTIATIEGALDEYVPHSVEMVAIRTERANRTTYVKLARMYEANLISREPLFLENGGGREYLYRKLPKDVAGVPLYDRQPGWDTLALARCLDLYTYRKKRAIIKPVT